MKAPNDIFKNWNKVCYIRKRITSDESGITIDDYGNEIQNYEFGGFGRVFSILE